MPAYARPTARKRLKIARWHGPDAQAAGRTRGKVALFATCYCNYSTPQPVEDLAAVLRHNGIAVTLIEREVCCGMPKLELGDLETVAKYKETEYSGAGRGDSRRLGHHARRFRPAC